MPGVIIDTQEVNPAVFEVTVNATIPQIIITVQEPVAPEEIHITVDPNAAQAAQNAADQAQDILDEIEDLISGVGNSFPFGSYTLYKAAANNDPELKNVLQPADTIAGKWSGDDYDDGNGIVVPKGKYVILEFNGGLQVRFANYTVIYVQP